MKSSTPVGYKVFKSVAGKTFRVYDGTDYTKSASASSFLPFYAQRLSWAAAKGTAVAINGALAKASRDRLRR